MIRLNCGQRQGDQEPRRRWFGGAKTVPAGTAAGCITRNDIAPFQPCNAISGSSKAREESIEDEKRGAVEPQDLSGISASSAPATVRLASMLIYPLDRRAL